MDGIARTLEITLELAQSIIDASVQRATESDLLMNVAVVDAGSNLKAFARMDGAWLGSIDVAWKKARTARYFDMETAALSPMAQPGEPLYHVELDRKSTRLNSSHVAISYAVFSLKKTTHHTQSS